MKVLFVGYRTWAFKIAQNLSKEKNKKWQIVGVITIPQPEAPFHTLTKKCETINPTSLEAYQDSIEKYKPDIILFYGWSWIIPKAIYEKYLCLCLHTSPLPKYRGGSPLQHQIIAGEKTSAVSIFRMVEKLDAGDIYGQRSFSLKGNIEDIFRRIIKVGTFETIKVLDGLVNKSLKPIPQDNTQATFYKRRRPEESELKPEDFTQKTSEELYNFIRALTSPYPNAFIQGNDGKKIFLKEVTFEED